MRMQDQPPWLAAAWRELGQSEIKGQSDNSRIVGYFRDVGHSQVRDDETAWCAAFAGAVLERSGLKSTRSLRARSYVEWGASIEEPQYGCIAVLSRGRDPALGHVGFVVGETDGGLVLLGGNQSNAVTVEVFARSRLVALRWPDSAEASVVVKGDDVGTSVFETALAHVLKMEGGFSDDPYDPGGPTNFGITLATYATHIGRTLDPSSRARLVEELRAIEPETVRAIYFKRYWGPAHCAELPAGVGLFHFDAAVNHGVSGAIRLLQRTLNVEADGEIGPVTRAAIRRAEPAALIKRYAREREQRYRALPHFWRFGRGWLNRVKATETAAQSLLARDRPRQSDLPIQPEQGDAQMSEPAIPASKWWGNSVTVWGAFVTAAAAILPALGPIIGLDINSDTVKQLGSDVGAVVQALAGVIGTLMTLYGRARATAPLVRRQMNLRV